MSRTWQFYSLCISSFQEKILRSTWVCSLSRESRKENGIITSVLCTQRQACDSYILNIDMNGTNYDT